MPHRDLEARLIQTIADTRLLSPGEGVLVGVSGGSDSVALLHLLNRMARQETWAFRLHVAHVDHQLRGEESSADAEFVRNISRDLGLPCTAEAVDVRAEAARSSASIEQAARQCRYAFYERTCLRLGLSTVALAHQADDNAETVLQRIVRGTGLRGLGGIRPARAIRPGSNIRVVRPLLSVARAELETYLRACDIPHRHDASNDLLSHTRNRLRHEVLPRLAEHVNPQVVDALVRLAEQARELDAYLSATCERMLESMVVEEREGELILHAPTLRRRARPIQTQLVRQALWRIGAGEGELTYGHFRAVTALAADDAGSRSLDLPGGVRVVRLYDRLVFGYAGGEEPATAGSDEVRVPLEGVVRLPDGVHELEVDGFAAVSEEIAVHLSRVGGRGDSSGEEWLDAEQIHPPLTARLRRDGDRFFPLGMPGMKKLSDFFIDEKIDVRARERTVLLCDRLGPIWVIPLRIDQRVRLTPATRQVMRVRVRRMDRAE
jgi:tRNA(Ile)-lysidine synthase